MTVNCFMNVAGLVATTPRHIQSASGQMVTSFRLAVPVPENGLVNNPVAKVQTNWFTVISFGGLADNVAQSIRKGDRIFVSGLLQVHDWESGGHSGTSIELVADVIGHDLNFGVAVFERREVGSKVRVA